MNALLTILRPLQWINDLTGRVGRMLSVFAIAIMVIVILLQVFFRYVLNNALPWPDEAARFMMLWLTGLMAPVAMRRGGMVAITSVLEGFPRPLFTAMSLILLLLSLAVLVVGFQLGWKHVNSGWRWGGGVLKLVAEISAAVADWHEIGEDQACLDVYVPVHGRVPDDHGQCRIDCPVTGRGVRRS